MRSARCYGGDLQNMQPFGKRQVETRLTSGRAASLDHSKADSNVPTITRRTDDNWKAWLKVVSDFCGSFRANSESIFVNKSNDNRPFVKLRLNNPEVEGLVDSSSNCTIIGRDRSDLINNHVNGKVFPSSLKAIRTADGKSHPVSKAIELEATLEASRRRIRVYVVPDLPHGVILGCDFCKLFELKIDFASRKIEIGSDIVRDNGNQRGSTGNYRRPKECFRISE
jgi:hypothetical protein